MMIAMREGVARAVLLVAAIVALAQPAFALKDPLLSQLEADARLKKAVAYFEAGRYSDAIPLLENFIKGNPYFTEMGMLRYALGYSYLETGRAEDAEKQLEYAADAMPDKPEALLALAQSRYKQNKVAPAAEALERYVKKAPKDAQTRSTLCQMYIYLEKYDTAEGCYSKAVALLPKSSDIWYQYGALLLKNGKTEEARKALAKASKLNPKMRDADLYIGMAAYQTGDLKGARDAFERLFSAGKADTKVIAALGSIYAQWNDFKKAEFYFTKALAKSPKDMSFLSNLVLCKVNLKKMAEAAALLEKAAKQSKNDPKILSMLVSVYIQMEKYGKAQDLLETLVKKQPKNAEYLRILATLYGSGFDGEKAAATWRRYLALKPNDAEARKAFAAALKKAGKKEDAVGEYEKAIALDPKDQGAARDAGLLAEDAGLPERAEKIYKEMAARFPALAFPVARLGELSFKAGDMAAAEKYFTDAMGKATEAEGYAFAYMGEIRYAQGKAVDAELLYRKGLEQMLSHSQKVFTDFMQQTQGSLDLMKLIEISEKEKGLEASLDLALAGVDKCFADRGDRKGEIEYLDGLIDKYATNKKLTMMATRLAKESGDTAKVLALSEKILKADVKDIDAHKLMGWAYNEMGDLPEAGKAYMRAVETNPSDEEAWNSLIDNYTRQDRKQDLETYATQKFEKLPDNETVKKMHALITGVQPESPEGE